MSCMRVADASLVAATAASAVRRAASARANAASAVLTAALASLFQQGYVQMAAGILCGLLAHECEAGTK